MNSTSNAGFGPVLAVRSLLSDLTVPYLDGEGMDRNYPRRMKSKGAALNCG